MMNKTKLIILPIIFISAIIMISCGKNSNSRVMTGTSEPEQPGKSQKAFDFKEKDIAGGGIVSLAQYPGKVILLNFWATWCPPCRAEIPDFTKLAAVYKDRLVIIGVSVDENRSLVPPFYKSLKMNYPVIYATAEMISEYGGISAIPTSFLINGKGEIAKKIIGYRDKSEWEYDIKSMLTER